MSGGGIRLTRPGGWFLALAVIAAIAALNTGNNGLFLALALMLAVLAVSQVLAVLNLRGLELAATAAEEAFAGRPVALRIAARGRGWLLARRWLLIGVETEDGTASRPWLARRLPPRGSVSGTVDVVLPRRGRYRLASILVESLFPFGFFRKRRRFRSSDELIVYPQLLPLPPAVATQLRHRGEAPSTKPGRGHELHSLRDFQHGDDPRGIHWKQTARNEKLIFQQRQEPRQRRLLIVLDNAVPSDGVLDAAGELDAAAAARFERLVSTAATAAVDHLERGFDVGLVWRSGRLPCAAGPRQRRALLAALALVEAEPAVPLPLEPTAADVLRLELGAADNDDDEVAA